MGDIVSLVERAQDAFDQDEAEDFASKIQKKGLDFEDMLKQFKMIKRMGSLESIMRLIPGLSAAGPMNVDDKQIKRTEAIIQSMTPQERKNAKLLNSSRRKRIARGSGSSVNDVNKLVTQLEQMNKMMKRMKKKLGSGKDLNKMNMKDIFKNM
jgi:signal recognition particle subunit SRP54